MSFWTKRIFLDVAACICLVASGIALVVLPVPHMVYFDAEGIRVCGILLVCLTMSPLVTHLNWINMRKEYRQEFAQQAK